MSKKRNIDYENKFRKYLFSGSIDRYRAICKNINVKSNQEGKHEYLDELPLDELLTKMGD